MSRAQDEKNTRRRSDTSAGRDRRAAPEEIVDSGLGLHPSADRRRPDVTDVIGPDRDDAYLERGGLPPDLTVGAGDAMSAGDRPERAEIIDEEPDLTTTPHIVGGDGASARPDVEPSLMDQDLLTDPMAAVGSPDDVDDPVADGDEAYVPPTDPVITSDGPGGVGVLGGFAASASESIAPARSASDGRIGDEAIADAVRDALKQDAATTDLEIAVAVRRGIVHLRGAVADLDDADNVEAVARRVEGVLDVVDDLDIATL